jgi:protein tyrosine phosphatase (PTP) superfamily phosphohydrolase (DUF442 family)
MDRWPSSLPRNSSRRRRLARRALLFALGVLAIPAALIAHRRLSGNLGEVAPGRLYRSAQLSDSQFADLIRSRGLRTVLNLRGPNPDQSWYASEVDATLDAGAIHVDIPLASDQWLSREQARTLIETLDTIDYPALVHCEFGAERTGLVSALARLLQPGSTLSDGYDEFSPRYLFVALKDGRVMLGHLDRYAAWLASRGEIHAPERLRSWLLDHYHPPTPSREQWPCDPYPRKVTLSRAPDGSIARDEQWPTNPCPRTIATELRPSPR